MINKKSLLLAATALTAVASNEALAIKAGPFVGATIGFGRTSAKSQTTAVSGSVGTVAATPDQINGQAFTKANLTQNHFTADILAGYLQEMSGFLVGGELTVGLATGKAKKAIRAFGTFIDTDDVTMKKRWTGSLNAVAGKAMGSIFAFAKLGLGLDGLETGHTDPLFPKKKHTALSVIPAVGAEYAVTPNIGVRAEASMQFYMSPKAKNLVQNNGGTPAVITNTSVKHNKMSTVALKGGVVYHV